MKKSVFNNALLKYKTGNIALKMILINCAIFLLFFLLDVVLHFFNSNTASFQSYFQLPADVWKLIIQPWSLVTYGFLHGGFGHIFFNMIILYLAGNLFLQYFREKDFLYVYIAGIVLGGILFVLGVNLLPIFGDSTNIYLVGASAGVFAILIAIATLVPNYQVRLLMFGNVKLWHIAVILVLLDLIQLQSDGNEGGHLAHFGGMLLGFLYARRSKDFKNGGINAFGSLFERKAKMKTVHKSTPRNDYDFNARKSEHQKRVDAILDKISESGYESLSSDEKEYLFKAGDHK